MSNPTPNIPGNGGSAEKSLNELLDIATAIYSAMNTGGIPIDGSGAPPSIAVSFATTAGPVDCTGAPLAVTLRSAMEYNSYKLVALTFDSAVPRDVRVSIVLGGTEFPWINLVNYTGPYIFLDDVVEGPGLQLRIEVSAHAGSVTYAVSGTYKA